MKRQRSMAGNGAAATTKKKGKKEAEKGEEEVVVVVEERRDAQESVAVAAEVLMEWDEWPWLWGSVVDEQMSWGSFWCPFWDLEFMGEAYNALYSDVVWDDDIWDLKGIHEVPNP